MSRLQTSAEDTDDLFIGIGRDRVKRHPELTYDKNIKVIYHVKFMLRYVFFGFAEHQEKGTYGLGYKLTKTRNIDNSVLNKANATNNAKIKINSTECFLPHCTSGMEQQDNT